MSRSSLEHDPQAGGHVDGTLPRLQQAAQQVEQGGLAQAGAAQQHSPFPAPDAEADMAEDRGLPIGKTKVSYVDHRGPPGRRETRPNSKSAPFSSR